MMEAFEKVSRDAAEKQKRVTARCDSKSVEGTKKSS